MQPPKHLLIFRFSALGDVAMAVPVIKNLLAVHSTLQVTVVSTPFHAPLFAGIPRLHFFPADKKIYSGITGLKRLASAINNQVPYDAVADLHQVLRTKILRFFLKKVPVETIHKGRAEKKKMVRTKKLYPLKTTFERYADTFRQLGFPLQLTVDAGLQQFTATGNCLPFSKDPAKKYIGIAPFARHLPKMYPLPLMQQAIAQLAQQHGNEIFLFGSREEAAPLQAWKINAGNITVVAGNYSFAQELCLINNMDVLLTMDSANMHLASLCGVPVVSLWGGTHPYLGFYGWGQPYENALQQPLPCRPSSVYGNKPCPVHGEQGCMQGITLQMIIQKVMETVRAAR